MTDTTTTTTETENKHESRAPTIEARGAEPASSTTGATNASAPSGAPPSRAKSPIGQIFAGALLGGLAAHGASAFGVAGLDGLDEDPARAELRRRADDFDRIEDEIELAQLLYARGANEKSAFADARTFYNAADEYRAARRAEVRAAHASVPGDSGEVDA